MTAFVECKHCGNFHQGICPRIKAIDYYSDGSVKRIEYNDPKPAQTPFTAPSVGELLWPGTKTIPNGPSGTFG